MVAARPQKTGSGSGTPTPDDQRRISAPGTYSIRDIIAGCNIYVERPDPVSGDIEQRQAEVLSVREKPKPRLSRRLEMVVAESGGVGTLKDKDQEEAEAREKLEYYVHYCEFNKRLDEWVAGRRLILSRELEWPKPTGLAASDKEKNKKKVANASRSPAGNSPAMTPAGINNLLKKAATQAGRAAAQAGSVAATNATAGSATSTTPCPQPTGEVEGLSLQRAGGATGQDGAVVGMEMLGTEDQEEGHDDLSAVASNAGDASLEPIDQTKKNPAEMFSKEEEIEKLRTSGSMTQSVHEIARVKNLNKIQMGKHEMETWYFSPYPIEYAHLDTLYICEMCLSYFPSSLVLARHRKKCTLLHPPGNEIYRHEDISFFEIDGKRQKTWCRNLCLISKCFLDHKTLYYDVDPFLYYIMCLRNDTGCHIIGYFSKEKESAENYNVACILTLPQHQRCGYGKLLIEFSYELTKREHKLGSPEKPLSDLGLLGYRAYWAEVIVELLLKTNEDISIDDIAQKTAIVHSDVLHTCSALNMLKQYQGKHYLVLSDAVIAQHEKQSKKKRRRIVPEKLNWKPPVFTRDQLRFGW
ncbi:putative ESA1-histone acetyltransferase [Tilletiaria anomala UBC 951]|uniref:histone acetyltransferase n=1 Tax=Tilletiaria anomala (strain ATCC 24038 / CBS 436.72 / UBC 951) TaxID=1037660 RepID=A0A066VU27_TILAU|nr:putative ESA1-histone acetyltransferase [Tilletiaria anomala UBC 951]KDN42070.1 putative ESA1-histone acetyltransferase [Tilletiaria anomala UBC 951]